MAFRYQKGQGFREWKWCTNLCHLAIGWRSFGYSQVVGLSNHVSTRSYNPNRIVVRVMKEPCSLSTLFPLFKRPDNATTPNCLKLPTNKGSGEQTPPSIVLRGLLDFVFYPTLANLRLFETVALMSYSLSRTKQLTLKSLQYNMFKYIDAKATCATLNKSLPSHFMTWGGIVLHISPNACSDVYPRDFLAHHYTLRAISFVVICIYSCWYILSNQESTTILGSLVLLNGLYVIGQGLASILG